jgi:cytoskeletal protein CcmA (bactofilin family)
MVKNLPSVERSTRIRFGKHVPESEDQAENTIVFNASNVMVPTPYSNSVYLSPIRNKTDYSAPEIVLLMYDRNTKEITESGESANALIGGSTLDTVANRNNATSNVVQFIGGLTGASFVTDSNVGLSNLLPQHTVSVGSNLYIDDTGSNVLVVSGNVSVLGNLHVKGDTTLLYTENTSIKDALIELGRDNTLGDTTLDLGVLMHRPDALSNVVIGYREGADEFAIAYTDSKPMDKTIVPKTSEDINVHVYGLTHVDANIYAHEDIFVDGNAYVTGELTVSTNVYADKDLEVVGNTYVDGNVVTYKDLLVTGNSYIDGNVVAYKDLLVTGNVHVDTNVNIARELTVTGNVYADRDLEVMGNTYVDGNVVTYRDLLVSGNVYADMNVNIAEELTVTGNVYADKDLEVTGNVYVTGNVNITNQLNALDNVYVSGNVEVTNALIVSGNTHLEGDNVFVTHTMDFLDPTTAIVTDQVSNVQIRLGQLENVSNTASNPLINQVLTYDQDNSEWSNAYPDQTIVLVKNTSGVPMTRGQAVHVTGSNGNNMFRVELADASNASKMPAIGIVYEDLPINGEGAAVTFGRANGISGISEFTNGDTLYVSNTVPGGLTNVKPYGVDLDLIQNIGVVVNHSSGVVFVTGIGRANDIPNARIETSNVSVNYVYVNSVNNDLRKIDPMKLPTKLQPLTDVVNTGNTAANAVTLRGLNITSGNGFNGDVTVSGNVIVDEDTLVVDSESHRVGLKTTSPNSNLHVVGNAFVTSNITTTSNILVVGEASATSKTTGALQVTGGVGIQGDIHATHANLEDLEADSVTVTDATAATSKTTGALQVVGGVGIQGDLYATDGTFTTNVYITNHADVNNQYLAMIDTNGSLIQSPVYVAPSGKYVITAAEAEFLGNITLGGNTTLLTSTTLVVEDRIIGIGSNNSGEGLDSGIIIEHQDEGAFANIALIHHADEHRFSIGYTQNTLSDNHILHASHPDDVILQIDLNGNTLVENSLSVYEMATFGTKVGIATTEPIANIHVVGNAFVTSNITTSSNVIVNGDAAATSKTTGALQVAGGVGIQGDIYGVTLYTDDYLTHIDDTNTKIGFPENDTFTVTTNNAERIRVNSSGHVGIGTASPSTGSNLHIFGETTTISSDTTGSSANPEVSLYRDQTGTNGNYLGQIRYDGQNDNDDDKLYGKITGKIKTATQGSEDGIIETALITGGSQRISVRHSGDLFHIKNGTDFEVGEVANLYVDTETSRVGINTDSPAYNLDVRGTSNVGVFTTPDASVTDSTASTSKTTGALKVTGGVGIGGDLFATAATFDGVTSVTDSTASSSKTTGALKVTGGVGVSGALYGAAATFDGVTSVTNGTASASKTTGALRVTGGVGVGGDLYATTLFTDQNITHTGDTNTYIGFPTTDAFRIVTNNIERLRVDSSGNVGIGDANPAYKLDVRGTSNVGALTATTVTVPTDGAFVMNNKPLRATTGLNWDRVNSRLGVGTSSPATKLHVAGGTIINSDGVAKKTYSYSGELSAGQTIVNSTIKITFSAHVFYAKIVAHLVESDNEVSTLSMECGGGHWTGGTPLAIAKGPQAIFGAASTNPWDSDVTTTATTLSIKPTTNMAVAGHYNVFIEYISQHSSGVVSKITEGSIDVVTFGY